MPPRVPKEARKTKKQKEDDWYAETLQYLRDEGAPQLADLLVKHEQERKDFRAAYQRDFIPIALRTTEDEDE